MKTNWKKIGVLGAFAAAVSWAAPGVWAGQAVDWNKIMTSKGNTVVHAEKNSATGFAELAVAHGGAKKTFYVTENGQYLFDGRFFDAKGMPLAGGPVAAAKGAPVPDWTALFQARGMRVADTFDSLSGFKGLVVQNGSEQRIFYITKNGMNLAQGKLYGADDTLLSAAEEARYVHRADQSDLAIRDTVAQQDSAFAATKDLETVPSAVKNKLFEIAESQAWAESGSGDNLAYIIFDPSCPHCHKTWEMLKPYTDKGLLRVRWIPVALLSGNNMSSAAAQSAAALLQNRTSMGSVDQVFGHTIAPVNPDGAMARTLSANLLFLRDTGLRGVPVILYRRAGEKNAFIIPERPEVAQIEEMVRGHG